ncbi:MAG: hypothetical protein JXA21_24115 [Anaerolineae bacterium]|nr:hypothetical protein [Anaerolineae bacterium]
MNTKIEKLTGKTLEEVDFGPYQQYVKEAVEDNGTMKIHTTQMPNALYATLRDYLAEFGFKRHSRGRYFFAPVTPESQKMARKLVGAMYSVAAAPAQETPAQSDTTAPTEATVEVKTHPAPKPGAKSKRAARKPKQETPSTDGDSAAGDVAFAE